MLGGTSTGCSVCAVQGLCLGFEMDNGQIHFLDGIPKKKIQVRAGDVIYQQGAAFAAVYAIVHGTAKAVIKFPQNQTPRIASLVLRGDLVGHSAISYGRMLETLIATEPLVACAIPYRSFVQAAGKHPVLWQQFIKATMRATRQRYLMCVLTGQGDGEKRVLSFLQWLAGELDARGQYANDFMLPMSKSDLANLLDLNHATLSRIFSTLTRKGIVSVQGPYISMVDPSLALPTPHDDQEMNEVWDSPVSADSLVNLKGQLPRTMPD